MFNFLFAESYENRKVTRSEYDWGFISTSSVNDGDKPFETAIKHKLYNNGNIIIVESYGSEPEAKIGHSKWEVIMNTEPEELVDIQNSYSSKFLYRVNFKRDNENSKSNT